MYFKICQWLSLDGHEFGYNMCSKIGRLLHVKGELTNAIFEIFQLSTLHSNLGISNDFTENTQKNDS